MSITKKAPHNGINYIGERFGKLTLLSLILRDNTEVDNTKRQRIKYLCKCDCGNEFITRWDGIKANTTISCGCNKGYPRNKEARKHLSLGQAAFNDLFLRYKLGAKKRGFNFEISKDRFKELTSGICYYCGDSPSKINHRSNMYGGYTYNGIDRIDSDKGYIEGNVVSCCSLCNYMKKNIKLIDFENHITKIYLKILMRGKNGI